MKHNFNLNKKIDSIYEKSIRENVEVNYLNELNSFLKVNSKSLTNQGAKNSSREKNSKNYKTINTEKEKSYDSEYMIFMPKKKIENSNALYYSGLLNYNTISQSDEKIFLKSLPQQNKPPTNYSKTPLNFHKINNMEMDFMKFKSNYLLKFASNHDDYDKMSNNFNMTSFSNQKFLREYLKNIKSITDKKERILFDNIDDYATIHQNKIEGNLSLTKDCTKLFYEFEFYWLRLCDIVFKEIKSLKDENISLLKKIRDEENSKILKDEEIQRLNKFIKDNEISYKSSLNGKKLKDLNEIREDYEKREKINLLNSFRLEEE